MGSIEKAIARLELDSDSAPKGNASPHIPHASSLLEKKTVPQFITETKTQHKLNFQALSNAGFLTPDSMQSKFAEEYRHLKRALLLNVKKTTDQSIENVRLIMVTSASSGEGKTFTAFNLAMTIANGRDTKALLIDGHLKSRALTKLCQLSDAPGLTDFLLDTQPVLNNVIVNTNVPGLKVIPAGRPHPDASELLASRQMEYLANDLATRFSDRLIVLDAPPLLTSMQSQVLASLAGQVLVVVEEGRTPKKAIQEAVSILDDTAIIGMLLNRCSHGYNNSGYNHQYGVNS